MPEVVVAGRRLEYRLTPPSRPGAATIVYLHEGLGSLAQWTRFAGTLSAATGCGTFAYSRWGYGGSDARPGEWPASYLHEEAATVLPALLARFALDRPILYGHSDGGSIALIFAAVHPGLVRAAVTEAAHVMVEDVTRAGIEQARARFASGILRDTLARRHGARAAALFERWSGAWLSAPFAAWDIRSLLPDVRCPLLVLQGLDDEYGTRAQVDAIARGAGGPVETWLIDGCGHAPHRDRAAEVAARAAAFIGALPD
jgi:pimeloyl-ACP methyl ester carboxylesterase